jgi:hypothetical protein
MNSQLILGDIKVNTINGRKLPQNAEFSINVNNISNDGIINIPFSALSLKAPVVFNCIFNDETFYPDYKWNLITKELELNFAYKPDKNTNIKLIFILNN